MTMLSRIVTVTTLPTTAAEARRFVRDQNQAAKQNRADADRAHVERQRQLDEGTRQAQAFAESEKRRRRGKPVSSARPARAATRPAAGVGWAAAIRKAGFAKDLTRSTGRTTVTRAAAHRRVR